MNLSEVLLLPLTHHSPNDSLTVQANSDHDPENSPLYVTTRRLQTVILPIICTFGLIANSLAIRTLLSVSLRTSSCSLYLASKCLADNGLLLSILVIWLYRVRVQLLNTPGICQITVFLGFACGFLSVWFVAIITCENYVRIAHPMRVYTWCTATKALQIIAVLLIIAVSINAFPLWTTQVLEITKLNSTTRTNDSTLSQPKTYMCETSSEYQNLAISMTYVDTFFTLLLPSLVIFTMVIIIVQIVLRSLQRRKRLRAGTQRAPGIRRTLTPQAKMTRFLFAISVIFLVLHTPSHVIRLKMMVEYYGFNRQPSFNDHIIHRIFELLYYFNFCNNCVVFLVFGDNFRDTFCQVFCPHLKRCNQVTSYAECRVLVVQSEVTDTIAVSEHRL